MSVLTNTLKVIRDAGKFPHTTEAKHRCLVVAEVYRAHGLGTSEMTFVLIERMWSSVQKELETDWKVIETQIDHPGGKRWQYKCERKY